jgi:hypothetical protein
VAAGSPPCDQTMREGHDFVDQTSLEALGGAPGQTVAAPLAVRLTLLCLHDLADRGLSEGLPDGGALHEYPAWRVALWQAL